MRKNILPCCFFPTTIIIVDDDETFLEKLQQMFLLEGITAKTFVEPGKALEFINAQNSLDLTRCYHTRVDVADNHSVYETQTDLSAIMKQADDPHRSDSLSVIISDYHMPQMNGIDLCHDIKLADVKKILLTAVAGDNVAVSAFNDGLIDQFISKGAKHLADQLIALVKALQFALFAEQSLAVYKLYDNAIAQRPFLQQDDFIQWFKQLLINHGICEFYLVTEFGLLDFVMIDNNNGKDTRYWLSIRDDRDMTALYDVAQSHGSTADILNQLKSRRAMPVVTGDDDGNCSPDQWHIILQPAHKVMLPSQVVYYSLVEQV